MSQTELRALATLGFDELRLATGGIGHMHQAIAGRVFRAVGPGAALVRPMYGAITQGVYAGMGIGTRALGLAAAAASPPRELSTSPRGSALVAAITGLRGDVLEAERSPLAQPMAVRVAGEPVPPEADALGAAFPGASPRIVVFLHGLMETEFAWGDHRGAAGTARGLRTTRHTYGTRLEEDLGVTPVYVRYNSGRRIADNGRDLSELLEQLVAGWPCEVEGIALVGHSMGGLVIRCACHQANGEDAAWIGLVRQSVSLGTPHMGAPLEQAVHLLTAGLGRVPETRAFANFFNRRSEGIRDLRRALTLPLCDGVRHCYVSATVTRSERHPLGRLLGDTLVLTASASGRSRTERIPFEEEYGMHVGGAHHFALLNHPAVYERLKEWLA